MHRHTYFDLWLHDDEELAALLGSPVVERTTLHEWPLSCVQRLRTADGSTRIYKAQAGPTLEAAFYGRATSPLLVAAQVIDQEGAPAALLLDHIAAPRLTDVHPTEAEALGIAPILLDAIARIAGDLPAMSDIRSEARWAGYAGAMCDDLRALVDAGSFQRVDGALIDRLAGRAQAPSVREAIRSPSGYVHRDLSGDNVLVVEDGYRVIDWQRPIWGPVALDLAELMESLGFDPRRYVSDGVVQLLCLLRIAWFAQCARRWFPAGAETYDAAILALAAQAES
jgi:hypothetical protein